MAKEGRKPLLVELPNDVWEQLDAFCETHEKSKVGVVVRALKAHMKGGEGSLEQILGELDPTVTEMIADYRAAAFPDLTKFIEAAIRFYIETEIAQNPGVEKRYNAARDQRKKRVPKISEYGSNKGGRGTHGAGGST